MPKRSRLLRNVVLHTIKKEAVDSANLNIVFLHGLSLKSDFFSNQLNSEEIQDCNRIAIDIPGHGKSEHLDYYSIPLMVQIILHYLRDMENIVLVGHSMGAHIAFQLLPYLKKRCLGVFSLSASCMRRPLNIKSAYNMNATIKSFYSEHLSEDTTDKITHFLYDKNDHIASSIRRCIQTSDPKYRSHYERSISRGDMKDEIEIVKKFRGKITFIAGQDDDYINLDYLKDVCSSKSRCDMIVIDNAGHSPHLERPDLINQHLAKFVSKVAQGVA